MATIIPLTANGSGPSTKQEQRHGDMRDYAGPNLFQPHRVKEAIRDAHARKIPPMLGYYAGLPSIPITRWLAPFGYDFCWIDWEHCAMSIETMTTMVHETAFMSGGRTVPFVRVPGHDETNIAFAMDAGASIVAPHVDNIEQAKRVIGAVKFGRNRRIPGERSAPPFRLVPGVTDGIQFADKGLWQSFNDQAALMIQIETVEGIENLDAILTEVGDDIDVVWLGRLDARISMGLKVLPSHIPNEPEWLPYEAKFIEIMRKHNKPYSGFCFSQGDAMLQQTQDMCMCVVSADSTKLAEMYGELNEARATIATTVKK